MKICNKCTETKELDQFGTDGRNKDGKQGICNQCKDAAKKAKREERVANKDYKTLSEKTCNKCGVLKPVSDFYKDRAMNDGHSSICKTCKTATVYKWRKENKPKYNALAAKWRDKNPDKQHATDIKRIYGLSIERYNEMLTEQGCKCKICSKPHDPSLKRGRLYVDHCHKSGEVRGLICGACNSAIGLFNDDVDLIARAIAYVKKHKY